MEVSTSKKGGGGAKYPGVKMADTWPEEVYIVQESQKDREKSFLGWEREQFFRVANKKYRVLQMLGQEVHNLVIIFVTWLCVFVRQCRSSML